MDAGLGVSADEGVAEAATAGAKLEDTEDAKEAATVVGAVRGTETGPLA